MKFGREFRDRLVSEGYPKEWRDKAFPYGALKKSLRGVESELRNMGLDPNTLHQLLDAKTESSEDGVDQGAVPVMRFDLEDPVAKGEVCPRLTVILELEDGVPVNSTLSPSSRKFLQGLAKQKSLKSRAGSVGEPVRRLSVDSAGSIRPIRNLGDMRLGGSHEEAITNGDEADDESASGRRRKTVELEFENHHKFFDNIQRDLRALEVLERTERQKLEDFVQELHSEITTVIRRPRKILIRKSDLTRWRQIFEVYMDAQVFFSRDEQDHGARDRRMALKQLQWFQTQVEQKKLTDDFQLEGSRKAYGRFLELNRSLVVYSAFQDINRQAFEKILKKFHKRTQLNVYPALFNNINPDSMTSEVSRALCVRVSDQLATLIPPLNQYLCPVCYDIAWLPMHLPCGHLLCSRCVCKLQQRRLRPCPECREPVVLKTNMDGIDSNLVQHLLRYYPDKVREKEKQNKTEMEQDLYGADYKGCDVM